MVSFHGGMEGRCQKGMVMQTHLQENEEEEGPPWCCPSCGKQNKQRNKRCEKCMILRPDERTRLIAHREQKAMQQGCAIGRGGGLFQRQDAEHHEADSDDEFDVYGRRKKKVGKDQPPSAVGKAGDGDVSEAAMNSKAARQKAALERLRAPRRATTKSSPARSVASPDRTRSRSPRIVGAEPSAEVSHGMESVGSASSGLDAFTEAELNRWVEAKRNKNFVLADSIRMKLRSRGINPDTLRPAIALDSATSPVFSAEIEEELGRWVEAKRRKDFALADSIRTNLRGKGIDPDTVRPAINAEPAFSGFSQEVEEELNRWVEAKRKKEFSLADSIRTKLRGKGVDPDTARPSSSVDSAVAAGTELSQEEIDEELGRWIEAKRRKDFLLADAIRQHLREHGINPDNVRPVAAEPNDSGLSPDTEVELDRWVEAKRKKEFALADNIRTRLRGKGIEPDTVRPAT